MHHNDIPHGQAVNQRFYKYYNISVIIKKKGSLVHGKFIVTMHGCTWHKLCSCFYSHET